MKRFQISLASMLWMTTCVLLFSILIIERIRFAKFESKSVAVSSPEHRFLLALESQILDRRIQLHTAKTELASLASSNEHRRDRSLLVSSSNLRNMELKLNREMERLDAMKVDVIQTIIQNP
jgi:hypothetical protein